MVIASIWSWVTISVVKPRRLDAFQLRPHGDAQRGIEVRERFIEQKNVRLLHQRAGKSYALLLAAGKTPASIKKFPTVVADSMRAFKPGGSLRFRGLRHEFGSPITTPDLVFPGKLNRRQRDTQTQSGSERERGMREHLAHSIKLLVAMGNSQKQYAILQRSARN
jgi:hypothetical protein